MTQHMIGKVLQTRYQIIQSLGAGVFGQTYIAVDIDHPGTPKCVVKQLKVTSSLPSYLETLRLRFLTETETLKQLGHNSQIPQLIACFEENERFYLVQEFIEGHALSAELPVNKSHSYLWNEQEVIQLLEGVLSILDFIHSQGVIHCDIKPENLIRRISDGKLVLIDFGSIQPVDFGIEAEIPIYRVPVTSLGYIPPEQFIGKTQPNSDIYALGMIAIQSLTGLTPLQLKVDPNSNEIIWYSSDIQVNDYLAAVLSQMIRYDANERFQSAKDVLRVLRQIQLELQSPPGVIEAEYSDVYEPIAGNKRKSRKNRNSPLLTGMKVGLAANSAIMGLGVYSLLQRSPEFTASDTVYKATEIYQEGDLERAIALMKSIPSSSNAYPEAQATIDEWQQQWRIAAEQYQIAKTAYEAGQWSEAVRAANLAPDILYWQSKLNKFIAIAKSNLEAESQELLTKAYTKAESKDFSSALNYLRQIPVESSAGNVVQQKLAEYNQKKDVRATYLLQQAYNSAEQKDFDNAVKFLKKIPANSPVYAKAQIKLSEYNRKQKFLAKKQHREKPEFASSPKGTFEPAIKPFIESRTNISFQGFNPGSLLQEVNIQ
ncbi:MAG: serine/threonine-protein kinase [Cyanobacteria bacterium P01_A01_bin.84]